ncbi:unnamed protein product [Rhizophagus irregularis]|nr:unnamed protein product [Rhizophagus irregularis]
MSGTKNINESTTWIEEAVDNKLIKFYEYKEFKNIEQIGAGGFGKVYRANWKDLEKPLAIKSFFVLDNVTMEEIVRELKNQREVDFHDNIIRCLGISKLESENNHNYLLVMEYADGADFGLSKRIGASSNIQSKLFGSVPYIDPKIFGNNPSQMSSLNEKSDVYSVGVLLWEISSGKPPFYVEDKSYDICLALNIFRGQRETVVPGTLVKYESIYTKCWDGEPDNRPTINEVVDLLKAIITKTENPRLSGKNSKSRSISRVNKSESPNSKDFKSRSISRVNKLESQNSKDFKSRSISSVNKSESQNSKFFKSRSISSVNKN